MPLYDYECGACGNTFEGLYKFEEDVPCNKCGAMTKKLPTNASFIMTGHRAASGYGLHYVDSPGKNPRTGDKSGHSFTSSKVNTVPIDHTDRA